MVALACSSVVPSPTPTAKPKSAFSSTSQATNTRIPTNVTGPPQALFLENRGGPALTVRMNDAEVAAVPSDGGERITPGADGVPALPWDIDLVRVKDNRTIFAQRVTELPRWLVFLGEEVVGPSDLPIGGPPGPACALEVSRDTAIELARAHTTLETLASATAGRFGQLNTHPGIGPGYHIQLDDLVWAVAFNGDVEICPPSPGECYSRPGTATVFLDYATGAFLSTQVYSPG